MLRLGFDLDGVLANHSVSAARKLGMAVSDDWNPPIWDWYDNPAITGVSAEYGKEIIKQLHQNDPHFWQDLPAYEPAVTQLREFMWDVRDLKGGVETYFITHRYGPDALHQSQEFIAEHGLTVNSGVICCQHKGEIAKALNLDFYIDDNWDNAASILHFTGKRGYLLDKPYNRGLGDESKVIRVQSVEDYLNDIRGFVKIL